MDSEIRKASYRRLASLGAERVRQGAFREALAIYEQSLALSREIGDADLTHEAISNLSMVRLELGEVKEAQKGLRETILRSRDERVVLSSLYNLAVSLRKEGKFQKALEYAHRAMRIAELRRDLAAQAMCHNLLGNIHLGQSFLDRALDEYRRSLALRRREKADNRFSVAIILENIGYCLLLKRQFRRGVARIEEALQLARETGDRRCQADCLQDLSYARLRRGDSREAARLGEQALVLALAEGYTDIERNCYYLLGEAAHLAGETDRRDQYFGRLQRQYPEIPNLGAFLCAVDLCEIITLKG